MQHEKEDAIPVVTSRTDLSNWLTFVAIALTPAAILLFSNYWYLAPIWTGALVFLMRRSVMKVTAFEEYIEVSYLFGRRTVDPLSIEWAEARYMPTFGAILILQERGGQKIKFDIDHDRPDDPELCAWLNYLDTRGTTIKPTEYLKSRIRYSNGTYVKK